jgi:hypothetical protein
MEWIWFGFAGNKNKPLRQRGCKYEGKKNPLHRG